MNYNQQHRPTGPAPYVVQRSPAPAATISFRDVDLHLAAGLVIGFALGTSLSTFAAIGAVAVVLG